MFSMYTYIFFYYLICTLQLVQLDIRYIFLALLLINMWMATLRRYHLPVFFFLLFNSYFTICPTEYSVNFPSFVTN